MTAIINAICVGYLLGHAHGWWRGIRKTNHGYQPKSQIQNQNPPNVGSVAVKPQ